MAGAAAAIAAAALFVAAPPAAATSAPVAAGVRWQPATPETVVLVLDEDRDQPLAALRRQLNDTPGDVDIAARFVRAALARYAVNGDARLLGYARGALQPWHDAASPPPSIWLLRGRLQQTVHEFEAAARDLDAFLRVHPQNIEALLLAADAWRRAGDVAAARRHCVRLQLAGRADYARLCAAEIQLALQQAGAARETATTALALGTRSLAGDERAWALAVAADAARAAGDLNGALQLYAAALEAATRPALALRLARIDAQLERGALQDAERELDGLPAADAVVLRCAIVAKQLGSGGYAALRDDVEQRFVAGDYAGTSALHLRERAIFTLDVLDQPRESLDYALDNWRVQKGWEDAAILQRAAAAAGDAGAAGVVRQWADRQRGNAT